MHTEPNNTRLEYIKRINLILDYVDKNLDADLSLDTLATKAHYSTFHFHRIFSAIVGETLNEYINRKRIERIATILLVGSQKPLHALAYQYGFNSDNSFSRAFKKYYGVSPTQFKSEGKTILRKIGIEPLTLEKYIYSMNNLQKWLDMHTSIEVLTLEEIHLAGIMNAGEFTQLSETYERLINWAEEKEYTNSSTFKAVTLYHDNPKVTVTSKVRYSACVTVDEHFESDDEIRKIVIEKGHYAVGRFEIKPEEFQKAWEGIFIWVVENGYQFKDGAYFEVYHNDHNSHPEQKFIVDICVPVESSSTKQDSRLVNLLEYNNLDYYRKEMEKGQIQQDYSVLMAFLKSLRIHFYKQYQPELKVGTVYQGNMNYSYLPMTTAKLKQLKLKFVLVFDHSAMRFEICLSGQNKSIRKHYWHQFKNSDWNKYELVEDIDKSLSIMNHTIVESPNFDDPIQLTQQIEKETLDFIQELNAVFED